MIDISYFGCHCRQHTHTYICYSLVDFRKQIGTLVLSGAICIVNKTLALSCINTAVVVAVAIPPLAFSPPSYSSLASRQPVRATSHAVLTSFYFSRQPQSEDQPCIPQTTAVQNTLHLKMSYFVRLLN